MAEIRLEFSDFDADVVEQAADKVEGAEVAEVQAEAIDLGTVIVVVAGAYAAAKLIMRIIDQVRGGVVLDMTQPNPQPKRNREMPYLWFLVIAKDGQVTLDLKDEPKDSIERLLEAILKLGKDASAGDVKDAVKDKLGDDSKAKVA